MKSPTPQEVARELYNHAEDLGDIGQDNTYGYGLVSTSFLLSPSDQTYIPKTDPLDASKGCAAGIAMASIIWIILLIIFL